MEAVLFYYYLSIESDVFPMQLSRLAPCFFFLFAIILLGAGCTAPLETAQESSTIPEPEVSDTHEETFDATPFIPLDATIAMIYNMDFDADGTKEHAIEYSIENVTDQHGQSIPKAYLEVFAWDDMGNMWASIKQDEIDTRLRKFEIEVLHFDTSPRDYLLVSKPSLPHGYTDGYYVFGDISNNGTSFGDIPLPKAYLHEEDYLNEGDTKLYFRGVSASADALIERYDVVCEAKEYTEPRLGDAPGDAFGPCRRLEVSQSVTKDGFVSEAATTSDTLAE